MSKMTSREQFDDFVRENLHPGASNAVIRLCWHAWEASRAAIEVELPGIYGEKYTPSSVTMDGFDFEEYLTDLYAAIEQANIKVKK